MIHKTIKISHTVGGGSMNARRMLMLITAAVLCMASAGVGAGAEWHVYPGAGTPNSDGD